MCFDISGKLGYVFPTLNKLHEVCWPLLRRVSLCKSMVRNILPFCFHGLLRGANFPSMRRTVISVSLAIMTVMSLSLPSVASA